MCVFLRCLSVCFSRGGHCWIAYAAMLAFDEAPLSVIVSWFDPLPQLTREFLLKYCVGTNEVEMVDLKTRKLFLRRTPCPRTISLKDLYVSNILLLHGRELKVECPGDKQTAAQVGGAVMLVVVDFPFLRIVNIL